MAKLQRDLIILIVIIAAIFMFNEGIKIALGTDVPLAIVEGNSMLPTFHDGDIILVIGVKPSDLHVSDIIIYKLNGKLIVHRIIDIEIRNGKYIFITKGDNNFNPDPPVSEDQVVGRVVGILIPRIGVMFKALMPYKHVIISLLIILAIVIVLWPSKKEEKKKEADTMVKFKKGFK